MFTGSWRCHCALPARANAAGLGIRHTGCYVNPLRASGLEHLPVPLLPRHRAALGPVNGIGLIIYALYSWLKIGQTPQGWTSLMIVVTMMGSVQLFILGIIGQYLARMHEQTRGRPLFIVDKVYRSGKVEIPAQPSPL